MKKELVSKKKAVSKIVTPTTPKRCDHLKSNIQYSPFLLSLLAQGKGMSCAAAHHHGIALSNELWECMCGIGSWGCQAGGKCHWVCQMQLPFFCRESHSQKGRCQESHIVTCHHKWASPTHI